MINSQGIFSRVLRFPPTVKLTATI